MNLQIKNEFVTVQSMGEKVEYKHQSTISEKVNYKEKIGLDIILLTSDSRASLRIVYLFYFCWKGKWVI